jgi:hypothetical protein
MANQVITTPYFESKIKRLKKKFSSLNNELGELIDELENNPFTGESLGAGLYKVRLASKSKGKSGGFRVITYLVEQKENGIDIFLITIYDKSEENSINKDALIKLVRLNFE